jgi:hypothetical protein
VNGRRWVQPNAALLDLMEQDRANGINPVDEIPLPGPPAAKIRPLLPVQLPEPDWREEAREQARLKASTRSAGAASARSPR